MNKEEINEFLNNKNIYYKSKNISKLSEKYRKTKDINDLILLAYLLFFKEKIHYGILMTDKYNEFRLDNYNENEIVSYIITDDFINNESNTKHIKNSTYLEKLINIQNIEHQKISIIINPIFENKKIKNGFQIKITLNELMLLLEKCVKYWEKIIDDKSLENVEQILNQYPNPIVEELNKNNIDNIFLENIMAFHYADFGACGESGEVVICYNESNKIKFYHTNLSFGDYNAVKKINDIIFKYFEPIVYSGVMINNTYWKKIYMGLGNHFFIREKDYKKFILFVNILCPEILGTSFTFYQFYIKLSHMYFNQKNKITGSEEYIDAFLYCEILKNANNLLKKYHDCSD